MTSVLAPEVEVGADARFLRLQLQLRQPWHFAQGQQLRSHAGQRLTPPQRERGAGVPGRAGPDPSRVAACALPSEASNRVTSSSAASTLIR